MAAGSASDETDAAAHAIGAGLRNPVLMEAALALFENRLSDAEPVLRAHLKSDPFDVAAIRMLAELAGRIGRYADAEKLLRRAVELAPAWKPARSNLAMLLHRQNRPAEAIAELDLLLTAEPEDAALANLKAAAAGRIGEYDEAIALYERVLAGHAVQPKVWMSYGHVLKTVGRQAEAVAAYRRALDIAPALGEVWWSLANLKTVSFDEADLAAMATALGRADLAEDDRFHIHFALGKALEDRADWERSFAHYAEGNALRRRQLAYDPEATATHVDRAIALLTPEWIERCAGRGNAAADPIFILGMPRAGSTLVEQILACHSQVEGTQELPEIGAMALRLNEGAALGADGPYPDCLADLDLAELERLGASFLKATRIHRKTGKAFFIDKMPNNWLHIGLIHLILPNARIIDARRHPLDCCFSNFKQHFARGQAFSYALEDMGRYYADYVRLMTHVDTVLPGRVHRVVHERLVDDTEAEVRALLAYLNLRFEKQCLRFWENRRAVQTASSEQVRRPINREGLDRWRRYEAWLGPLKTALGPVLEAYPDAPRY